MCIVILIFSKRKMQIAVADRAQLANRQLSSIDNDDVPSGMPTPFRFPTSYPTNVEMPTDYLIQQELTAPSSVPTLEFDSQSADDDLSFSVPKDVEGLETSTDSHHSLPSGTSSCVLIITAH
jgi:hypothetical protein